VEIDSTALGSLGKLDILILVLYPNVHRDAATTREIPA
jgi:hypothetical protein